MYVDLCMHMYVCIHAKKCHLEATNTLETLKFQYKLCDEPSYRYYFFLGLSTLHSTVHSILGSSTPRGTHIMKPSIAFLLWTTTTTTTTTTITFVDAKARAFLVRPTTTGVHRHGGLVSFLSLPRGGGGGGEQYSHDPSGGYYPEDEADPYSSRSSSGRRPNNDDYYYGGDGTGMNQDDRDYYSDQDRGMVSTSGETRCCFGWVERYQRSSL